MLNFRVYGPNEKIVTMVTRSIGRALFMNDMDVKDYVESKQEHAEGVVRSEKGVVDSIDPSDSNSFVFIGNVQIRGIRDGATVVFYNKEKIGSAQLKKHKTKNYIITYESMPNEEKAAATVLGGITKIFDKISAKNMKMSIEREVSKEKSAMDAFEEGYKNVKLLR